MAKSTANTAQLWTLLDTYYKIVFSGVGRLLPTSSSSVTVPIRARKLRVLCTHGLYPLGHIASKVSARSHLHCGR